MKGMTILYTSGDPLAVIMLFVFIISLVTGGISAFIYWFIKKRKR